MSKDNQQQRSRAERIERLRQRLVKAKQGNEDDPVIPIVAGILDLLEDEL